MKKKEILNIMVDRGIPKPISRDRWEEDTMILVHRSTRAKLKMKALKKGISVKDLLKEFANQK